MTMATTDTRAALDRERKKAQQIADDIVWADRELRGRIGPQDRRLLRLREHAAKLMQFSRSAPEERGEGEINEDGEDELTLALWRVYGWALFAEDSPERQRAILALQARDRLVAANRAALASPPAPVERCVCSWCGVEVAETNEENACPLCVRHYGLTPPHAEEEHPRSFVTDEVREQAGAPAPVGGTRDHEAWLDFACAINIGKCHGLEMEEAAAQHLEAGMRQIVREEIAALAVRVPLRQSPASDSKYETGATVPVQGERGEEEPGDALFDAPCTCPHCGFVGTIAGPYHDCKDGTRFSSPAPAQEPEEDWLHEYERRKLEFSEANWRAAEWDRNEDDDPYEDRQAALEAAEIALDRHVLAAPPVSAAGGEEREKIAKVIAAHVWRGVPWDHREMDRAGFLDCADRVLAALRGEREG